MKSLELKPTKENLLNMFLQDSIGRNEEIFYFIDLLNSINTNYAISLDGEWGSGKTFFIKQVKMVLDSYNNINELTQEDITKIHNEIDKMKRVNGEINIEPCFSFYYDAWENDNDEDPIISLIYNIYINSSNYFEFDDFKDKLFKAGKIFGSIFEIFSGRNINVLIENLENIDKFDTIFQEQKNQKSIKEKIGEFLNTLIEDDKRVIIFIDELDRCKPSFAVKLLERIKHYFDNDKIIFVFSVNFLELQHTIKNYYGDNLNASKYIDRFFDLHLSLVDINKEKYFKLIGFSERGYVIDNICKAIINYCGFELREINKFYYLTKAASLKINRIIKDGFSDENTLKFCINYVVPIIIGLRMYDINIYNSVINGRNSQTFVEIFTKQDFLNVLNKNIFLNENETYNNGTNELEHVNIKDKINQLYKILFVKEYSNMNLKNLGKLEFNEFIIKEMNKAASFMSMYADYKRNN